MDYPHAQQVLETFINYEHVPLAAVPRRTFSLDRIRALLSSCGDPHRSFTAIHVAGTKGKGSVCAMIASLLQEAGYRVGLYTSPHLSDLRERIRINGSPIDQQRFAASIERISASVPAFGTLSRPTYFEVLTALAFCYFADEQVPYAVIETGLGGRLDATNVCVPAVTVLTPVSFDHTQVLGDTIGRIAAEKAGIIKRGVPCVCAPQEPEAMTVIARRCAEQDAPLVRIGTDVTYRQERIMPDGQQVTLRVGERVCSALPIPLTGDHQMVNAATALGAVNALAGVGARMSEETIRAGFSRVRWPGRLERFGERPAVILDGAQNGASAAALVAAVRKYYSYARLIIVCGIAADKDIARVAAHLSAAADEIILTQSRSPRACPVRELETFFTRRAVRSCADVPQALAAARAIAAPEDLIVVTGSLYVVGEARTVLCRERDKETAA